MYQRVHAIAFFGISLFLALPTACSKRDPVTVGPSIFTNPGIGQVANGGGGFVGGTAGGASGAGNLAVSTVKPVCEVRLVSPNPHLGGTWAKLVVKVGLASGNTLKITDANRPNVTTTISPIHGERLVKVFPTDPLAKYVAETEAGAKCEVSFPVSTSSGGYGMFAAAIVVVESSFPIPPPPTNGYVPVFELKLTPICSIARADVDFKLGNHVANDIFVPGNIPEHERLHHFLVLSLESGGKTLFGRIFERNQHLLNRVNGQSFGQLIPLEVLSLAGGKSIDIRLCIKKILPGQLLTEADFTCSNVVAGRSIGVGKEEPTNVFLTKRVATFEPDKLRILGSPAEVKFWNTRGYEDGATCVTRYSPLVLDTQGDGIQTTDAEYDPAWFNMDAKGEVNTGWLSGRDDAFLVRDLNGDGKIDSGRELFGSATLLKDGRTAPNGFEALRELDSNGDSKFSRADKDWSQVKLWFAHDFREVEDYAWKLYSLDSQKIDHIVIDYMEVSESQHLNEIKQRSTFFLIGDALERAIVDIWFRAL